MKLEAIAAMTERSGRAIQSLAAPGVAFEQSMADLSAIAGVTGNELDSLGDQARKVGRQSGLGAAQAVNAYKTVSNTSKITTNLILSDSFSIFVESKYSFKKLDR